MAHDLESDSTRYKEERRLLISRTLSLKVPPSFLLSIFPCILPRLCGCRLANAEWVCCASTCTIAGLFLVPQAGSVEIHRALSGTLIRVLMLTFAKVISFKVVLEAIRGRSSALSFTRNVSDLTLCLSDDKVGILAQRLCWRSTAFFPGLIVMSLKIPANSEIFDLHTKTFLAERAICFLSYS